MKIGKCIYLLTLAAAVAGCATPVDPALQAAVQNTIPVCSSQKECEVKWNAAQRWVVNNAGMKLQHITPELLQTYNPGDSMRLAVEVIKEARQDGSYRIVAKIWCGNPFGCDRNIWQAILDFQNTVNASWKS